MTDLIDTTEMYLRTIYELEEEGTPPLRARIAERLEHSVPTVSQTIARMQRDGLVQPPATQGREQRQLVLTQTGRLRAMRVMRKHRLAECLLAHVIALEPDLIHEEACRWEHVMSESVERRLVALLEHPHVSPFGNPIPGLQELEGQDCPPPAGGPEGLVSLHRVRQELAEGGQAALPSSQWVGAWRLVRIGEHAQSPDVLRQLRSAGLAVQSVVQVRPDGEVHVQASPVNATLLEAVDSSLFVAR